MIDKPSMTVWARKGMRLTLNYVPTSPRSIRASAEEESVEGVSVSSTSFRELKLVGHLSRQQQPAALIEIPKIRPALLADLLCPWSILVSHAACVSLAAEETISLTDM